MFLIMQKQVLISQGGQGMTRNSYHDSYNFQSFFSIFFMLETYFFLGQHHPLQNYDVVDSGKTVQPDQTKSDHSEKEATVLQWTNSETVAWANRYGVAR